MLLEASRTVADGGDPPGMGDSYYRVRAIEDIVPNGVQWRDALMPDMYPEA
tara:strand:- start:817 stop:969 length:153 start_codon:yes stop_codon:yes gene_type:complete